MATKGGNQPAVATQAGKEGALLSAREYAAHRGVSHQAVGKALRDGRLSQSARKDGRTWRIDPVLADQEWARTTDASLQRGKAAQASAARTPRPRVVAPTDDELADVVEPPPEALEEPLPLDRHGDFQEWRTRREEMQARNLWLDVAERRRSLVPAAEVQRVVFEAARQLRNGMLALPPEVAGEFAGCTEPRVITATLEQRIHALFERFETGLRKLGGPK